MTGRSPNAASFQTASAFPGAGYTTEVAEQVAARSERRRIVEALLRHRSIPGNSGLPVSPDETIPNHVENLIVLPFYASTYHVTEVSESMNLGRLLDRQVQRGTDTASQHGTLDTLLRDDEEVFYQFTARLGIDTESVLQASSREAGQVSITPERILFTRKGEFIDIDLPAVEVISARKGGLPVLWVSVGVVGLMIGSVMFLNDSTESGLLFFLAGVGVILYLYLVQRETLTVITANEEVQFNTTASDSTIVAAILLRELKSDVEQPNWITPDELLNQNVSRADG